MLRKTFIILTVVLLVLVCFLSSFSETLHNKRFYEKEYEKLGIDGMPVLENTLNFFEDKEELRYFDEGEKAHMQDVKDLIKKTTTLYNILLIFLVLFLFNLVFIDKFYFKDVFRIFLFAGIAVVFIGLLFYLFKFSFIFEKFHCVFFTGNYMFAPGSMLIYYFPERFFYDIASRIFVVSLVKAVILVILGSASRFSFYNTRSN